MVTVMAVRCKHFVHAVTIISIVFSPIDNRSRICFASLASALSLLLRYFIVSLGIYEHEIIIIRVTWNISMYGFTALSKPG